jgi:hypothetical protein
MVRAFINLNVTKKQGRPVIPDYIPVNFDEIPTLRLSSHLFFILPNIATNYGKGVNQNYMQKNKRPPCNSRLDSCQLKAPRARARYFCYKIKMMDEDINTVKVSCFLHTK